MISYHIKESENYQRATLDIKTWFAEKQGIANRHRSIVEIQKETEKAYLVQIVSGIPKSFWLPKSLCRITVHTEPSIYEVLKKDVH